MEGEKGLLEGGAGARVAGCYRETGACSAVCCLVFWTGRQQLLISLLPAGPLGARLRHRATASAGKFADSREMKSRAAQSVGGDQGSSHLDALT